MFIMKKNLLTILAVTMAIGLTAFTASPKLDTLYYQFVDENGNPQWGQVDATPCPPGIVNECLRNTPHGSKQMYDAPNGNALTRQP